jgi:hypothetical protein
VKATIQNRLRRAKRRIERRLDGAREDRGKPMFGAASLRVELADKVRAIGVGGITFSGVNKIEFVLTHSDDDSSYAAVTDADMLGVTGIVTGIIKSLIVAHAAAAVYRFGYVGGKRYLKLLADFSGTHGTGTALQAAVVKGNPHRSQA